MQAGRLALPRYGDDRRPIHIDGGKTGDHVGGAVAECRQANAGVTVQATVDIGHERRPLFLMYRDQANLAVPQDAHHMQVVLAGNAKRVRIRCDRWLFKMLSFFSRDVFGLLTPSG